MSGIYYHRERASEYDWTISAQAERCEEAISQEMIDEWIVDYDKKWYSDDATTSAPTAFTVEEQFRKHAEKWERETAFMSATPMRVMHESYQSVMAMGPEVVPLMLRDLQKTHRHWFWALRHLTGHDPVSSKERGNVESMANAWIKWGKEKGKL